jgi:hypothetical protein
MGDIDDPMNRIMMIIITVYYDIMMDYDTLWWSIIIKIWLYYHSMIYDHPLMIIFYDDLVSLMDGLELILS